MKKLITLLLAMVMIFTVTACGSTETQKQLTNTAEYDNSILELEEANIVTTDNGDKVVKVEATYTNKNAEPLYALSAFAVRAFQNDKELTDISDINGDEASLIQEVKDGQCVSVNYAFILDDDSEVEILIGEPTADQTTIGQKTYFKETK